MTDLYGEAPRYTINRMHPEGPEYPKLSTAVAKYRHVARKGLKSLDRWEVEAYAAEIEKSIKALQRSELMSVTTSHPVHCASGTAHTRGKDISRAIRARHNRALLSFPEKVRRERKPKVWREMYLDAMKDKAEQSLARQLAAIPRAA